MRFMVPWVTVGGWSCLSWVIFLWPIDWKAHQEFRDVVCDIFSVKLPPDHSTILVDLVVKGDVLSNERRKQLDSVPLTFVVTVKCRLTEKRFIFDHKQQGRGRQQIGRLGEKLTLLVPNRYVVGASLIWQTSTFWQLLQKYGTFDLGLYKLKLYAYKMIFSTC